MRKEEKKDGAYLPEDDGKTIANMNIEGMPWYKPASPDAAQRGSSQSELSDEELKAYRHAAIRAALLIVLIFIGAFGAFIAFCDFVWFR